MGEKLCALYKLTSVETSRSLLGQNCGTSRHGQLLNHLEVVKTWRSQYLPSLDVGGTMHCRLIGTHAFRVTRLTKRRLHQSS